MRRNILITKKKPAQAMVEFAIVLPLLLLLLYGILEAGRLLFIYSTIVTASRQAVRYGSATGLGAGVTVPRYQDCAGIRAAAQKADYLNVFDDEDIYIYHDDGPNPTDGTPMGQASYCTGAVDTWVPSSTNNQRVVVEVRGDFLPIVPKLIPFIRRSVATGNPITALSRRTVLVSVSIVVTAPPATWRASTPTFTPSLTPSPTNTPTETPTLTPSATATYTRTATPYTGTPPTATNTFTPTYTPTMTLSPTVTSTATVTRTLTPSPTPIACGSDVFNYGQITISGEYMTLNIHNGTGVPIVMDYIRVSWNHDDGHKTGSDHTLRLLEATLKGVSIWSGIEQGPDATLLAGQRRTIPVGDSVLSFRFHQTYSPDRISGEEAIYIPLLTNGCQNYYIQRP